MVPLFFWVDSDLRKGRKNSKMGPPELLQGKLEI